MTNPQFFVPATSAQNIDSVYAEFARMCSCAVPHPDRRIYSIIFSHDGERWTATVGETLSGVRTETKRQKGSVVERLQRLSDPAVVLAIFPGVPYMVVTNHGIAGNVGSRWTNPFLAGQPQSVEYFS